MGEWDIILFLLLFKDNETTICCKKNSLPIIGVSNVAS
jgi:hypothetical protein